ncbi:MAG: hypothetical protein ACYC27_16465 [Armatimonadota bacterium]
MHSSDAQAKTNINSGNAPKGNTNAVKHGIYTRRLVSDEERELYDSLLGRFRVDYPNTDDSLLQETVLYVMRLKRALDSGNIDGLQKMDSKLRKALKKIRYHKPEIVCENGTPMTREEWMADFIERTKKHRSKV